MLIRKPVQQYEGLLLSFFDSVLSKSCIAFECEFVLAVSASEVQLFF